IEVDAGGNEFDQFYYTKIENWLKENGSSNATLDEQKRWKPNVPIHLDNPFRRGSEESRVFHLLVRQMRPQRYFSNFVRGP
ncbi:unnamed protein product, partial [Amoebophrya sp. A25]